MSWRQEFLLSIKSFDTEEKLDLYFYRPLGFLIAKASLPLGVSPTQLTIAGLLCGLVSAFFFVQTDSNAALALACALLVLAGIFDSSDGQLARMGGKSTKLGLVLDGLCDNLVFASAYISCTITLLPHWGMGIWPVALLAGICHSLQSSMLDYYNREYLYFGVGKRGDYWNPTERECAQEAACLSGQDKILWRLRASWLWQQQQLSCRTDEQRQRWRAHAQGPRSSRFQELYREHNRLILRWWRLMGPNFHTILLIASVFGRRFDLYLILGDILFLSLALILLRLAQNRRDKSFERALRAEGFA